MLSLSSVASGFASASMDETLKVTDQMKATEQSFPVLPFIILYIVVLTFEAVVKPYCY